MQNWSHLQVKWAHFPLLRRSQISLTARLFAPQPFTKRISRLRLLAYQALVLGWTVRVSVMTLGKCIGIVTLFSASHLRQSILLSSYETPETRSLFNKELRNVAGKIRTQAVWSPVQVPEGIQQVRSQLLVFTVNIMYITQGFMKFECASAKDEINKRFEFFTMHVGSRSTR